MVILKLKYLCPNYYHYFYVGIYNYINLFVPYNADKPQIDGIIFDEWGYYDRTTKM